MWKPVVDLRTTTILRAFLINAIIVGLVTALSIELREYLDILEETKYLPGYQKILINALMTTLIIFIIYILSRWFFGFGDGMLSLSPFYPKFI